MSITTAREATELLSQYTDEDINSVLSEIEEACINGKNYIEVISISQKTRSALLSKGFEVVHICGSTSQVIWPIY